MARARAPAYQRRRGASWRLDVLSETIRATRFTLPPRSGGDRGRRLCDEHPTPKRPLFERPGREPAPPTGLLVLLAAVLLVLVLVCVLVVLCRSTEARTCRRPWRSRHSELGNKARWPRTWEATCARPSTSQLEHLRSPAVPEGGPGLGLSSLAPGLPEAELDRGSGCGEEPVRGPAQALRALPSPAPARPPRGAARHSFKQSELPKLPMHTNRFFKSATPAAISTPPLAKADRIAHRWRGCRCPLNDRPQRRASWEGSPPRGPHLPLLPVLPLLQGGVHNSWPGIAYPLPPRRILLKRIRERRAAAVAAATGDSRAEMEPD